MKRKLVPILAVLVLASLIQAQDVKLDVTEHTLANGLKILMVKNPGVPRVVCHIYYKVGSINEKPGITGLAQVKGRSCISFDDIVQYDVQYIETQSLVMDLKILWRTIAAVLSSRGAG